METPMLMTQQSGWTGKDLEKASLVMDLSAEHHAAIRQLMIRIRSEGLRFWEIDRSHFQHPALNGFLGEVLGRMKAEPGIVIVRNFPVNEYSLAEIECIYWGMGTHFGSACSQS